MEEEKVKKYLAAIKAMREVSRLANAFHDYYCTTYGIGLLEEHREGRRKADEAFARAEEAINNIVDTLEAEIILNRLREELRLPPTQDHPQDP